MAKKALLIGVSQYEAGLPPLAAAPKDVAAMLRILQNPELGAFDDVKTLIDPDLVEMQEAIALLFQSCQKGDLGLLYFSGHGITDDGDQLYLATRRTSRDRFKANSVPASFIQNIMGDHYYLRQQVLILDCCYSGAFAEGWQAKSVDVNLKLQLEVEGSVVLTSSTSTQKSYEDKEGELSLYTTYIVQGIESGAAARGSDGFISADELHDYAKRQVQLIKPAMKPEIYGQRQGIKIVLFRAKVDTKLAYRRLVAKYAENGEISLVGQDILELMRELRGLSDEVAITIENEVLEPDRQRLKNLARYQRSLERAVNHQFPLSQKLREQLKDLQEFLGLRDEDISSIQEQVAAPLEELTRQRELEVELQRQAELERRRKEQEHNRSPKTTVANKTDEEFFEQGRTQEAQGNPQGALENYANAIRLNPNFTNAYYGRGLAKFNLGDKQGAIADYNEAIRLNPNYADAYNNRGLEKSNLGDKKGAIADYNEALRINPDYANVYNRRGIVKSDIGDQEGAIADYTESIRLNNPELHLPYNNRGIAKKDLGDKQGAIADYSEAIRLNPNYADAYYNCGLVKKDLEDKQGAIADYNEAIRLNPNYANAYFSRGLAKSDLGDKQGAITDYSESIRLGSKDVYIDYNNRGLAKFDLGDKQGAIADYNEAIRLKPDYTDAYVNRGLAKEVSGDSHGGIADYNEAIRLKPDYALAYYNRGVVKNKLEDKQGAIADYSEAIHLNPNYTDAYYNRGLIKKDRDDKTEALADFRVAAQLYEKQGNTTWLNKSRDRIKELGG